MLMQASARLATDGLIQPGTGRMSTLLFEFSRLEYDMRARWVLEAESIIASWPEGAPTEEEVAALQAWFLERSQVVAAALQRFRVGETLPTVV
jgi:hypothetical protein